MGYRSRRAHQVPLLSYKNKKTRLKLLPFIKVGKILPFSIFGRIRIWCKQHHIRSSGCYCCCWCNGVGDVFVVLTEFLCTTSSIPEYSHDKRKSCFTYQDIINNCQVLIEFKWVEHKPRWITTHNILDCFIIFFYLKTKPKCRSMLWKTKYAPWFCSL